MRYRVTPHEVDAFEWTAGPDQTEDPIWLREALENGKAVITEPGTPECTIYMAIPGGLNSYARVGDWVVRYPDGLIVGVTRALFSYLYEVVKGR